MLTAPHRTAIAGLLLLVLSAGVLAQSPADTLLTVDPAAIDPDVPRPDDHIGHAIGDRAVRYEPMVRYLRVLADASPRVTMTKYATSHEGRDLYYLTVTSEANHGRLEDIRRMNAALADPRKLSDPGLADVAIDQMPAVAWLAYCIHGDELSPTDAAVQVIYQLAAATDAGTRALLDEVVVHVDPLQNPDGRERVLSQIQSLQGAVPNSDYQAMQHMTLWSSGRGNHYLVDLNRDWLMLVHPETRGRVAVINEWNPHFLVDAHEMSGLDTYLFDPPREPFNVSLSEATHRWRKRFSEDQAGAFDAFGWSYYTEEWYEEWYPGYTNAWANLRGTIGLLYEAPTYNSGPVKQATGQVRVLRDAVHRNVVGTFANLETLRANRREILRDYHEDRVWAISDEGPFRETYLFPPTKNTARMRLFRELLERQGIEYTVAGRAVQASEVVDAFGRAQDELELPIGTIIVSHRQPLRRWMHAMLGFDPRMTDAFLLEERRELENRRGSRLYDTTAWNIPMAYGLEAYRAAAVQAVAARQDMREVTDVPAAGYGYVIDGASDDVHVLLARLFERGVKVRVMDKAFTLAGRAYEPGAVVLRGIENPRDLRDQLAAALEGLDVDCRATDTALTENGPDLGGQRCVLLHEPRVAIASQWPIGTTAFGATWHLFDVQLGMRVSPVNVQRLGGIDLRKYNVLILPSTWSPGVLRAVLEHGGRNQLKQWVESGGTLIAVGSSAAVLADEKSGLSQVRRRRDVIDDLEVYVEAINRERGARYVSAVNSDAFWTPGPGGFPVGSFAPDNPPVERLKEGFIPPATDKKPDKERRKRDDEWQRRFSPAGVFLFAECHPEHWLCFGAGKDLPVQFAGSSVFLAKPPVESPVLLNRGDHLRLSGLLWPEGLRRIANSVYLTRESVGRGQVILFANDPFVRGYLEGSGRLLRNAVMYGPGMGASQPIPW